VSPLVAPLSCPLVVLSLHHHLVVLRRLVVLLPLDVPPSRPLVALPSCPLVARRLIVVWPPSNDATAIERPPAFAGAKAVAAVGGGTAITIVELTIVHCQKERQHHHHHQHTSGSTNMKTFTSPDNLDLLLTTNVFATTALNPPYFLSSVQMSPSDMERGSVHSCVELCWLYFVPCEQRAPMA
jgi:hypothetical protein